MKRVFQLVGLVLALSSFADAQTPVNSQCPALSINGPSGVVNSGDIAKYTVQVDTKGKHYDLGYKWSISDGEIVSGQGTVSIQVRVPEKANVTVTVEIAGLPKECPRHASDSACGLRSPEAIKLDEFVGPLSKISKERFAKIVESVKAQRYSQLVIIISGNGKNPSTSIKLNRKIIVESIVSKLGEDYRATFVDSPRNDDRVVVWLVPPGANRPECIECEAPVKTSAVLIAR